MLSDQFKKNDDNYVKTTAVELIEDLEHGDLDERVKVKAKELYKRLIDSSEAISKTKRVSVYIDGAFDLVHSGHFNAIRQARALADHLVVGCNLDEDILKHKGHPVLNVEERKFILESCRWVGTAVVTPYVPSIELLD